MLSLKYIWSLTQNFNEYSDIIEVVKTVENKEIGSLCKIFIEKNRDRKLTLYIWFKGSELSIRDILIDMFFFKKKLDNKAKVHAGFWTAVESIFDDITDYLNKYVDLSYIEIVILGHSLGAAMAKEFARRLQELIPLGLCIIKIITFGSPRCGNKHYAKLFDRFDIQEYILKNDVICKLPLKIMNYSHVNKSKIKYLGKWGISCKAHLSYGKYLT
ncbi:MAG: lipase family protein [Bacteroidales bacterium]|nr:lipase family protein [Bacteroidales bacterium]